MLCCVSAFIRAGKHCRLLDEENGTAYHAQHHVAHATAEMCRPYLLGSITVALGYPVNLDGRSLQETESMLQKYVWTDGRVHSPSRENAIVAPASMVTTCANTFFERLRLVLIAACGPRTTRCPMGFVDICVAYYYRRLQIEVVVHVCQIGYCRKSWNDVCNYHLPETELI